MFSKINGKFRNLFEIIIGIRSGDSHGALYHLFCAAVFFVIAIFCLNMALGGTEKLGQWGDFFGGVLNPLLTFLTFTGLLITIVLQQTELREARTTTDRQIFEATFFQMLTLHNTIVNSIRTENAKGAQLQGRDCFNFFYTQLSDIYKARKPRKGAPYYGNTQATINQSFRVFWRVQQRNLGHYYRYLYNIIRFVNESSFREGPYIRLIRAQLSDQELLMLFYNCLAPQGEKFKQLAEQFALFDNMNPKQLLEGGHAKLIAESAFGEAYKAN